MTRRRSASPSSMFRGTELPRLLILLAIVLAGWPMVAIFARPGAEDVPPPRPVLAAEIQPVTPDLGVEFEALIDKAPVQARESAAYAELLRRARETPARELATTSRKDLLYTHLWERPERYRGVPVHIEGTARRILTYEVNPSLAPKGRLFEAWVYSDENRAFPYALIFEDPPAGLPIGPDLFVRIKFDGYFLKLLGYHAGDKLRGAPMLVGRLRSIAPQAAASPPMVEFRNYFRGRGLLIFFGLLMAYVLVRAILMFRKATLPSRSRQAGPSGDPDVPPGRVDDWLRDIPDDDPLDVQRPR